MKWVLRIIYVVIFIVSLSLILVGQRNVGPVNLLIMLCGLMGILVLMFIYNKKYQ